MSDLRQLYQEVILDHNRHPHNYREITSTCCKAEGYNPLDNLSAIHESYPDCCVYLSMLSLKGDWYSTLPRI